MTRFFTLFFLLFSTLTVSAQTAGDCAIDPAPLPVASLVTEIGARNPYTNGTNETFCVSTFVIGALIPLGTISMTSNDGGTYPFSVVITDLTTSASTTLSAFGDIVTTIEGQRYFMEIIPTGVGTGDLTLTPDPAFAAFFTPATTTITVDEALPVTWSAPLTCTTVKNDHTFSWGVSLQENVAAYHLQTSTDSGFETIATASPKPSYGGEIFYELTAQARAEDAYYRISQVDFDGSESAGNVVFVPGQSLGDRLSVYPNPAREQVWVQGVSAGASGRLLSATGQTVRSFTQVTDGGRLDVSGLKAGVYTLQLLGEDKNAESVRVVIR